MRSRIIAVALAALIGGVAPANAATIYTFSLSDGSAADFSSILSYSFGVTGPQTLTLSKTLDSLSPIVFNATITGTHFSAASFAAYQDAVLPSLRLWEYAFTDVLFASVQVSGESETVTLVGKSVAFTSGPAATPVPEPNSLFLTMVGALVLLVRRRFFFARALMAGAEG